VRLRGEHLTVGDRLTPRKRPRAQSRQPGHVPSDRRRAIAFRAAALRVAQNRRTEADHTAVRSLVTSPDSDTDTTRADSQGPKTFVRFAVACPDPR
jgi:hypothetical protein